MPADATRNWPTSAEDRDPVHTSGSRSLSRGRAHDNKRVCSRHSHNSRPRSSGAIKADMYGLRLARGRTCAMYGLLARPRRGSAKDPSSQTVVSKRLHRQRPPLHTGAPELYLNDTSPGAGNSVRRRPCIAPPAATEFFGGSEGSFGTWPCPGGCLWKARELIEKRAIARFLT